MDMGYTEHIATAKTPHRGQLLADLVDALNELAHEFPGTAALARPLRALVEMEFRRGCEAQMEPEEREYHWSSDPVHCPGCDAAATRQTIEYKQGAASGWRRCEICGSRYIVSAEHHIAWIPVPGVQVRYSLRGHVIFGEIAGESRIDKDYVLVREHGRHALPHLLAPLSLVPWMGGRQGRAGGDTCTCHHPRRNHQPRAGYNKQNVYADCALCTCQEFSAARMEVLVK